ncbi:aldo/keto reductase [Klebsiella pneumoniae]|nr:aldo/keto reductase [Klebsiella pneumoniae]
MLASKVSGPARNNDSSIRPNHVLDRKNIREALHASLEAAADRLSRFISGSLAAAARPAALASWAVTGRRRARRDALDTLEALTRFQRAGKIRYIGVSNETAFGVMRYLRRG